MGRGLAWDAIERQIAAKAMYLPVKTTSTVLTNVHPHLPTLFIDMFVSINH
jgi:hypothetical protein